MRLLALAAVVTQLAAAAGSTSVDLVVYSATPAGIASAVVAARQGQRTLLVEPEKMIGGLLTCGLSYTDFKSQEAVTGFFREYMDRVLRHYRDKYGADSQQARDCYFGAHAEPHVSLAILHRMIGETKGLALRTQQRVVGAERSGSRIDAIRVAGPAGEERIAARAFIDASYEGTWRRPRRSPTASAVNRRANTASASPACSSSSRARSSPAAPEKPTAVPSATTSASS
jgi:hypothetical protein